MVAKQGKPGKAPVSGPMIGKKPGGGVVGGGNVSKGIYTNGIKGNSRKGK